jgi:hypothetical protein
MWAVGSQCPEQQVESLAQYSPPVEQPPSPLGMTGLMSAGAEPLMSCTPPDMSLPLVEW